MLKVTILALCLVAAWAAPADKDIVPIVSQESDVGIEGKYHYSYESADGTKAVQDGELKQVDKEAGEAIKGSFDFETPDGQKHHIEYTADENGYVPSGDIVPPIPEPIARALAWAAEHPYKEEEEHHKSKP